MSLIAERALKCETASSQSRRFKAALNNLFACNRAVGTIRLAARFAESPVAAVIKASFDESDNIRPVMWERQREIVRITEDLKRGLWALSASGWSMMVIGLLVFVVSLFQELQIIGYGNRASIQDVGSLASSLFLEASCIVASAPVIWSHKYFTSKLESFELEMDRLSLAVLLEIIDESKPSIANAPSPRYITRGLDARATSRFTD
jgi:biopolymer transport protein ExbB/TolQ